MGLNLLVGAICLFLCCFPFFLATCIYSPLLLHNVLMTYSSYIQFVRLSSRTFVHLNTTCLPPCTYTSSNTTPTTHRRPSPLYACTCIHYHLYTQHHAHVIVQSPPPHSARCNMCKPICFLLHPAPIDLCPRWS